MSSKTFQTDHSQLPLPRFCRFDRKVQLQSSNVVCALTDSTWGEGASDATGHGVPQGALRPLRQDGQQQAGHPVKTLAAGEVLTTRAGDNGLVLGPLEAQHPPKPAVSAYLRQRSRVSIEPKRRRQLASRYSYHDAERPEKAAEDGAENAASLHNTSLKTRGKK